MRFILLVIMFVVAELALSTEAAAQNGWHNHGGRWHQHQHNNYHYHYGNRIAYQPIVTWYPSGTWLNVGPINVSPDRRYIRMGINAGFTRYQGYSTFNFRTGATRHYPYFGK